MIPEIIYKKGGMGGFKKCDYSKARYGEQYSKKEIKKLWLLAGQFLETKRCYSSCPSAHGVKNLFCVLEVKIHKEGTLCCKEQRWRNRH